jgi:hypothetical protein
MSCENITQVTKKIDCCVKSTGLTCRKGCKSDGGGECVPDTSGGSGFTHGACPSKGPVICDVGGTCEKTSLEKEEPSPCKGNCWTPLTENTIKACNADISRRRGGGGGGGGGGPQKHPHRLNPPRPRPTATVCKPTNDCKPDEYYSCSSSKCKKTPHNWTDDFYYSEVVSMANTLSKSTVPTNNIMPTAQCIINGIADKKGCNVKHPDEDISSKCIVNVTKRCVASSKTFPTKPQINTGGNGGNGGNGTKKTGLSGGEIAAIVIGSLALLGIIIGLYIESNKGGKKGGKKSKSGKKSRK